MKLFDLDWETLLELAGPWHGLEEAHRLAFADVMGKAPLSFHEDELSCGSAALERAGILERLPTKPDRLRLTSEGDMMRRLIRHLSKVRSPLTESKDGWAMSTYVPSVLATREVVGLLGGLGPYERPRHAFERLSNLVIRPSWIRGFLESQGPTDWEPSSNRPEDALFSGESDFRASRRVVEELDASGGRLLLDELAEKLEGLAPGPKGEGLRKALAAMLVFPWMDDGLIIGMGILPWVHRDLHRKPAPPPEDLGSEGLEVSAFLLEDMTAFVVEAAAEPVKVRKNDGRIFSRTLNRLLDSLPPLGETVRRILSDDPEDRLAFTRYVLLKTGLLRRDVSEEGRSVLAVTRRGREWVAGTREDRLRWVIDWVVRYMRHDAAPGNVYLEETRGRDFPDYSPRLYSLRGRTPDVRGDVLEALGYLDGIGAAGVGDLIRYLSPQDNPLAARIGDDTDDYYTRCNAFGRGVDQGDIIEEWARTLHFFLMSVMLPLGCVGCRIDGKKLVVGLTDAGRYLLGLRGDFSLESGETAEVVVQPDFSVVFMAPSPGAEVVLSQFAERTGREVGVVFRITQEGVMRAASAGIGPKSILFELEKLSQREVPENVRRQIEEWCGRCRKICKDSVILIRCPDAETALRVKSAGRGKLERLNETDLALADRKALKTITRRLRKKGITFE
jgi:hypothetical protein